MYKRILVAYDGTEYSDVALNRGADLALICKAELHLVGIVATKAYMLTAPGLGGAAAVDIWGLQRQELEDALETAGRTLSAQGQKPTTSLREGNPAQEIAACAVEQGADLVVVGHSEKGVLARWFEGSVGQGLLRDLPCNLLVATD